MQNQRIMGGKTPRQNQARNQKFGLMGEEKKKINAGKENRK
jgi:hypothetical protein